MDDCGKCRLNIQIMDKQELLWRHYELNIQTHRGYLELALKINIFYYAITGAILSYYFAHSDQPLAKYALILPLAMSFLLALFFGLGAFLAKYTRQHTRELGVELGFKVIPEVGILILFLGIFAVLMVLVALGLSYLIWC